MTAGAYSARGRSATITPLSRRQGITMLELNSVFNRIHSMQERTDALRGYL